MIDHKKRVYDINKKYEANGYNGLYGSIVNLKIVYGKLPILLSAPHSVKHYRDDQIKDCDGLTGGIVEYLAEYNNTYGITRTSNLLDDPNYYNSGDSLLYKKSCIQLIRNHDIKYLFDIHGCMNAYPFDIDIGTTYYGEELDILYKYLSSLGKVEVNKIFKASNNTTVTRYVQEQTNIPCFQIELSRDIRFGRTGQLIREFNKIIDEVKVKKLRRK